jgi:hypothetical protein
MGRSTFGCTLIALWLAHSPAGATSALPAEPVQAIWRIQSVPFEYRSDTIYYSCDSLEKKIEAILRAVGAHESVAVQTRCEGGPLNRISARIALATPMVATEENVRGATTFSSEDKLVARLNDIALPTANDLIRFSANWQIRPLSKIRGVKFTMADCDLLKNVSEQIFPRIDVRLVKSRKLMCGNHSNSIRPNLQFEALIPLAAEVPLAQL